MWRFWSQGRQQAITWSCAEMLSASAAAAKAAADGSMWGRSVSGSEILSTSKKRLPGMRLALKSCLGSLPVVHSEMSVKLPGWRIHVASYVHSGHFWKQTDHISFNRIWTHQHWACTKWHLGPSHLDHSVCTEVRCQSQGHIEAFLGRRSSLFEHNRQITIAGGLINCSQ